jgi:hypothetical protein
MLPRNVGALARTPRFGGPRPAGRPATAAATARVTPQQECEVVIPNKQVKASSIPVGEERGEQMNEVRRITILSDDLELIVGALKDFLSRGTR